MLHARSVFRILYDSAPGHNLLYSPLSATPLLGLLFAGTRGEAHQALRAFFALDDDADAESLLFRLAADLKAIREGLVEADYQLSSAFWFHGERLRLHPEQRPWFREVFQVNVNLEDFRRDTGAQERLDDWSALVTRGHVDRLPFPSRPIWVPPDQPYPLFLGANALYLQARWERPFYSYPYETDFFRCQDGTERELFFMERDHETGDSGMAYFSEAQFHAVQIPFADSRLVFEVFLPHARDGLDEMLSGFDFSGPVLFEDRFEPCDALYVLLPIFEIGLRVPFTYGGLGKVFSPLFRPGKDFDQVFVKAREEEPLGMSDMVQAVNLRVDLLGVEVEAVPANFAPEAAADRRAPAEGETFFLAEHPFYYQVRDRQTGRILLMGTFCQPAAAADWPRPITDTERRQRGAYRSYLRLRSQVTWLPPADLLAWALAHLRTAVRKYRLSEPIWAQALAELEGGDPERIGQWMVFWDSLAEWSQAEPETRPDKTAVVATVADAIRRWETAPEALERGITQALRAPVVVQLGQYVAQLVMQVAAEGASAAAYGLARKILWLTTQEGLERG